MSADDSTTMTVRFALTSAPSAPRVSSTVSKTIKACDLRVVASAATHIPLASLKLIFRGRIIQNDDKIVVTDYNVDEDSVIHCLGKPDATAGAGATSATASASTVTAPAATTTATPTTAPSTTATVESAMATLKSSNPASVYSTALSTLVKVASNIISHPTEEKYRKVKRSNAAFARRLGAIPGGPDAMTALGFTNQTIETEAYFVLEASADAWTRLTTAQNKIQSELDRETRGSVMPPAFSMPGMPAAGGMPGMGGGMPNMPPGMEQQMAQMMADPNAMQNMLQNPMVRQAMQSDPRIANNPMLRQAMEDPNMINQISQMMSDPNVRQMMSNPAMMQSMMSQMPPGMGGGGMPPAPAPGGAAPGAGGMDPAAMARMMQAFSSQQQQNRGAAPQQQQQQPPNSNANTAASEREQTEEEMIAEAIARSLREP